MKRRKVEEAFGFANETLSELVRANQYQFIQTEYIRSENEKVITYKTFRKLMALIDPAKPENQIKILFQLLDSDDNQLLGWFKSFSLFLF